MRLINQNNTSLELSSEQERFIQTALDGNNILVEACIGSGKTTAIQALCNIIDISKNILYLTYNKLLKLDAQEKIKKRNVTVTNYHGFVYPYLKRNNIPCSTKDCIGKFVANKLTIKHFDILIVDEYQDIEKDFAELLEYIKSTNPKIQIVMVGDMAQKIYDKTSLVVEEWADKFLDQYIKLEFTQCFRIQPQLANKLGTIWGKKIIGINTSCKVEHMNISQVTQFLSTQSPKEVLCLGKRDGNMSDVLNSLEERYPRIYNKNTVYATIRDSETSPRTDEFKSIAIFTTFDGCKGMERPICVVFDWDREYYRIRGKQPKMNLDILRNIFCVAASRGKKKIIFVADSSPILSEDDFLRDIKQDKLENVNISDMLSFKYIEDIMECHSMLDITKISECGKEINIKSQDGLIDLSPCIGVYQEVVYFKNYKIDTTLKMLLGEKYLKKFNKYNQDRYDREIKQALELSLGEKILLVTALETHQNRYIEQVKYPFVSEGQDKQLIERLSSRLDESDRVQEDCLFDINDIKVTGRCDVIKEDAIWELKFTSELSPEHFLQLAMYLIGFNKQTGYLWNTRTDELYLVGIKEGKMEEFKRQVYKTITKKK